MRLRSLLPHMILLTSLGTLAAACQPEPATPDAAPTSVEASEPAPPSEATSEGSGVATPAQEAPAPEMPSTEPPRLVPLMQSIGFTAEEEIDIAEFVHAPPGAHTEAASFGSGARQVRVALVVYPNPRYAEPHYNDVLERSRVIAGSSEAVLRHENVVIHLRAVDRESALAVRDALASALMWPSAPSVESEVDAQP